MRSKKIFIAALWLILAVVGSARIEAFTEMRFNLTLAALVALSFFLDVYEALFVSIVAILLVNWLPAFTLEIALYPVMALSVVLVRRIFQLKLWLNAAVAAFLAIAIVSLFVAYGVTPTLHLRIIVDGLVGALFAGILFTCMGWAYHEEQARRRI